MFVGSSGHSGRDVRCQKADDSDTAKGTEQQFFTLLLIPEESRYRPCRSENGLSKDPKKKRNDPKSPEAPLKQIIHASD